LTSLGDIRFTYLVGEWKNSKGKKKPETTKKESILKQGEPFCAE